MPNDQKSSDKVRPSRRKFIKGLGGVIAGAAIVDSVDAATVNDFRKKARVFNKDPHRQGGPEKPGKQDFVRMPLSTNSYPWQTFYRRQGRNWEEELPTVISEIKKSGADCLEPSLKSVAFTDKVSNELEKQGVGMISIYVGSELHEKEKAKTSIDGILDIVKRAKKRMGTRIVVTNPNPINWSTTENKTDDQLEVQRDALNRLGKALASEDMTLAYHFHAPEFRAGAREFHHMLAATDPRYVKMCLDSHWVFRGAGDSNVALHDVVRLYGKRVVELHIRQSKEGIWTETFGEGDIDHKRLTKELKAMGVSPLVTMEQAVEDKSPNSMDGLAAHTISHAGARKIFDSFIG